MLEMTSIDDLDLLAAWLGCSMEQLAECVQQTEEFYKPKQVRRRRRSRRPRTVFEVLDPLSKLQRRIALDLRRLDAELPDCVYGFRTNRSAHANAARHCNREYVATVDLSDFFDSISYHDVREVFDRIVPRRQVAIALARLCTLDGVLPQGARTSPALANRVAGRLDDHIMERLPRGTRYTRYADDLTFSGGTVPDEATVADWVGACRLKLRPRSYRVVRRGGGQYVTGLHVEGRHPRAPRRVRRSLDRLLFFAQAHGYADAASRTPPWAGRGLPGDKVREQVHGLIAWIASFDEDAARDLTERCAEVEAAAIARANAARRGSAGVSPRSSTRAP